MSDWLDKLDKVLDGEVPGDDWAACLSAESLTAGEERALQGLAEIDDDAELSAEDEAHLDGLLGLGGATSAGGLEIVDSLRSSAATNFPPLGAQERLKALFDEEERDVVSPFAQGRTDSTANDEELGLLAFDDGARDVLAASKEDPAESHEDQLDEDDEQP